MKFFPPHDPKYWRMSFYALITFALAYTFTKLADQFGTILIALQAGLHRLIVILTPLFIGLMLAYVLYPLVKFFEKRLLKISFFKDGKHHVRPFSVVLTMASVFIGLTIISSVLISAVNHELQFVSFDNLDVILKEISQGIYHFTESLERLLSTMNISSGDFTAYIRELGNSLVSILKNYGLSMTSFISNMTFSRVSFGPRFR